MGKSSLLSMVVCGADGEVSVIALADECGREVRNLLENDLRPARSEVVVSTGDEPAAIRHEAAFTAIGWANTFAMRAAIQY